MTFYAIFDPNNCMFVYASDPCSFAPIPKLSETLTDISAQLEFLSQSSWCCTITINHQFPWINGHWKAEKVPFKTVFETSAQHWVSAAYLAAHAVKFKVVLFDNDKKNFLI